MRFQLLLVGLATAVCIAVGGMRLRAKLVADTSFARAERAGRWTMITGDYAGLHRSSRWGGAGFLPGFENTQASQAWDVSADLELIAIVVDGYGGYGTNPGVKVFPSKAVGYEPVAEIAPSSGAAYCPLFDEDRDVLFLESRTGGGVLRRLDIPEKGSQRSTALVRDVRTASPLHYGDCFERSTDGERLAWIGTDGRVHVASRSSDGSYLLDHKTFAGSDFALSPDGKTLAVRDGTGVSIVNVESGAQRQLLPKPLSLVDFSPDGTWLSVIGDGSLMGRSFLAVRVGDATEVTMEQPPRSYYGSQPGTAPGRWISLP